MAIIGIQNRHNKETRMRGNYCVLTIILLLCCSAVPPLTAYSQTNESGIAPILPSASAASYYYISKPGELTMQVNIWGSVRNPGRYEVPTSTDLVQLVSFAGGPTTDAEIDEVQVIHTPKMGEPIDRDKIVVDLSKLNQMDPSKLTLRPGDTIFIDHSGWASFRDILTVVTAAAVITSAVANVIVAEHR